MLSLNESKKSAKSDEYRTKKQLKVKNCRSNRSVRLFKSVGYRNKKQSNLKIVGLISLLGCLKVTNKFFHFFFLLGSLWLVKYIIP